MPTYRIQILRHVQGTFCLYYFQLSGEAKAEALEQIFGEMQKALGRLELRFKKQEEGVHTYLVYEEGFQNWLRTLDAEQEWQERWRLPVYSDYHQTENLKLLLQSISGQILPKKAIVLGCGIGMQEWLPMLAGRVQDIELYLEFMTKGVEVLQERLCEEYGMLTQVKLVSRDGMGRERLRSDEPVLVVDFSGNGGISVLGLSKGSIWMDMDSVEAKRHMIEDRQTGLSYLSLKTIWKREMLETLDTICKFAYNT